MKKIFSLFALALTVGMTSCGQQQAALLPERQPLGLTSQGGYTLHGCSVFDGDKNVIGRKILNAPVDSNSASIISHMPSGSFYGAGNEINDFRVNLAGGQTPKLTVQANSWRNPPVTPDDNERWSNNFFIEPVSDGHAMTLDTATCEYWETYNTRFSNGVLSAYAGDSWMLNSQTYQPEKYPTTVSYIPLIGFTDLGEDAALPQIPHPIGFFMNKSGMDSTHYTGPAGAAESAGSCSGGISRCLMDGDLLRLKPSFNCSGYGNAVDKICVQLKTYGTYLTDDACCYGLRVGLDSSGNNPWTNYGQLAGNITINDFDVIQRGTVH